MSTACRTPLLTIPGTGFNTVEVPQAGNASGYNDAADKLLYEIWQTLLLILANTPATSVKPILFTIGDGQADTPLANTNSIFVPSLQGQSIVNKQLIVFRNGVLLQYSNGITPLQIIRHNNGVDAGFTFDPASGLTFQPIDSYQIFITGTNSTIE